LCGGRGQKVYGGGGGGGGSFTAQNILAGCRHVTGYISHHSTQKQLRQVHITNYYNKTN